MNDITKLSDEELERLSANDTPQPVSGAPLEKPHDMTMEDVTHIAGQSMLTLGLGDEAAGLGAAVGYLSGGGTFAEATEMYQEAKNTELKAAMQAKKDNPIGHHVVDFAATAPIATASAPMALLQGAAYGAGSSENGSRLSGAAMGTALSGVGLGVGKAASAVLNKAAIAAKNATIASGLEELGAITKPMKDKVLSFIRAKGLDPMSFIKDISTKEVEYNGQSVPLVVPGQPLQDFMDKADILKNHLTAGINELVHSVDNEAGGGAMVLGKEFATRMDNVSQEFATSSSETKRAAANVLGLRVAAEQSFRPVMTLRDLHTFNVELGRRVDWNAPASKDTNLLLSKAYHAGQQFLQENIEKYSQNPEAKSIFLSLNRQANHIHTLTDIVENAANGTLGKNAGIAEFGEAVRKATSNPISTAINIIGSIPGVTPAVKNATLKVMEYGSSGGKGAEALSRIIGASAIGSEAFEQALAVGESQSDLSQSPVERTSQDLLKKQSHIYHLINDVDPKTARQFKESLNSGDSATASSIANDFSRLSQNKTFFQPGIGWDGRVTNEAEKQSVKSKILDSNSPTSQKLKDVEALDKEGLIPLPDSIVRPMRDLVKHTMPPRVNGRKVESY